MTNKELEKIAHERPSGRPRYPGKPSQVPEPGGASNPPSRPPSPQVAAEIQAKKDDATRQEVAAITASLLSNRIAYDQGRETATRQIGTQHREQMAAALRSSMRSPRPGQGINWYSEPDGYSY